MNVADPKISAPLEAGNPDLWGPELAAAARRSGLWKAGATGIAAHTHYTAPPTVAVTTV